MGYTGVYKEKVEIGGRIYYTPFRPRSRREVIDYCLFQALLYLAKPYMVWCFILLEVGLAAIWSSEGINKFLRGGGGIDKILVWI